MVDKDENELEDYNASEPEEQGYNGTKNNEGNALKSLT
jgi:hypothetical protein